MKKFFLIGILVLFVLAFSVPCFAQDGISVQIVAGVDKASSSVTASGQVMRVMTDTDIKSFKIEDDNLKEAWHKYFGGEPNDVWVRKPASGRDLYTQYGWPEVQTVLKVKSATVMSITSKPTIIASRTLTNSFSKPATFNASISETIQDSTTNSWTSNSKIYVKQKFSYGVTVHGETTLEYAHEWGRGYKETKDITVGSTEGVTVELDPGQSADVQLTASSGTMKVRIVYEASLTGESAANYNPKHKGHHFWNWPINDIMKAAKLPTTLEFTEDIEVGYFSNAKVEIKDAKKGTLMHSAPALIKR